MTRVELDGGRQRSHTTAPGLIVVLLVFTGVGFLAGWITGEFL